VATPPMPQRQRPGAPNRGRTGERSRYTGQMLSNVEVLEGGWEAKRNVARPCRTPVRSWRDRAIGSTALMPAVGLSGVVWQRCCPFDIGRSLVSAVAIELLAQSRLRRRWLTATGNGTGATQQEPNDHLNREVYDARACQHCVAPLDEIVRLHLLVHDHPNGDNLGRSPPQNSPKDREGSIGFSPDRVEAESTRQHPRARCLRAAQLGHARP
jgi:hypothetical protein